MFLYPKCFARTASQPFNVLRIPENSLVFHHQDDVFRQILLYKTQDFIFNNAGASVVFIVFRNGEQLEIPGAWERFNSKELVSFSSLQISRFFIATAPVTSVSS